MDKEKEVNLAYLNYCTDHSTLVELFQNPKIVPLDKKRDMWIVFHTSKDGGKYVWHVFIRIAKGTNAKPQSIWMNYERAEVKGTISQYLFNIGVGTQYREKESDAGLHGIKEMTPDEIEKLEFILNQRKIQGDLETRQ